jgi:predicted exporter
VGRRAVLGIWLSLVVLAVGVTARVPIRADMTAFLPSSSSPAQQVLTDQVNNGASSRIVLLAIDGAPPAVLAALSKAFAAALRHDDSLTDVTNGDDASLSALRDFFWQNRYLLAGDVSADRFTADSLHAALVNDVSLLGSDMAPLVKQTLPGDPTGEILTLLHRLGDRSAPHSRDGVWFSGDEKRALLMAHTRAAGFDINAEERALASIRAAFDQVRHTVPAADGARLRESGPSVFAVSIRNTTIRDATRLSLLATAIAASLLMFAYRSPLLLVLGLLPVASGALAAVAGVALGFGFVHGITLGFGVTLIGESVDYAIYLFTQTIRGDRPEATIARIWPTLRLCASTSIAGFAVMLFSSFVGFAQLGLFSIVGLIAAIGVTRFVLPQLTPRHFFAVGAESLGRPLFAAIAHRSRLRPVVAIVVLAAAVALLVHRGGFWDGDINNLSPVPRDMQALDRSLRHDLAVPDLRYFVLFAAPTEEAALAASETLARQLQPLVAQGRLGGYDVPSEILPSKATQRARQAMLPDADTLRARFTQAVAGLPFRADAFAPFFNDVARSRSGPLADRTSLPSVLALQLDSMLVQRGDKWQVIAPLQQVHDPAAVVASLRASGLPEIQLIDLDQETGQLLRQFQREATSLAVIGSAAIVLLLFAALRSPTRVVAVTAPIAAALIVTAAFLSLGGGKLSIFMIVGFLLTVAVGSNYCLFFERAYGDDESRKRSFASVVLANLCTVSAYGAMSLSGIPVLHDIGMTVAIGAFLCLIFSAVLTTNAPVAAGAALSTGQALPGDP